MKTIALTALALFIAVPVAHAEDRIEFYADAAMIDCNIVDNAPQIVRVHMFHVGTGVSRGVVFSAPTPACWAGATWLGDIVDAPFGKGDATHPNGIIVLYGECMAPPGHIGYMNFAAYGQGLPCCEYAPAPHVQAAEIRVTNCDTITFRAATGRRAIINGNASCPCVQPVPVSETTWGKVKSLYQ